MSLVLTLALSTRAISISPWTSMSATVVRSALRAGHRAWRRREDPPRGPRAAAGRRPLGNLPSQRSVRRVIGEHDAISQLVIAHDTRRGRRSTLGRRDDKHGRRPPGAPPSFHRRPPDAISRPSDDRSTTETRAPAAAINARRRSPCPDRWSGFFSQNGGLSERQRPTPYRASRWPLRIKRRKPRTALPGADRLQARAGVDRTQTEVRSRSFVREASRVPTTSDRSQSLATGPSACRSAMVEQAV